MDVTLGTTNSRMYSLIIPVYKNEASIPDLLRETSSLNDRLEGSLEVIFVVDGSPDRSFSLLQESLSQVPYNSRLLLLSRNFGSFAAIRAGLQKASGHYFAVMAADLQEPPELILDFFKILKADEADIVLGTRRARHDPLLTRVLSRTYWWCYRHFVQPETPQGGVDVFGCNDKFRQRLLELEESHSSIVGLILWLGFRRTTIPYARARRQHGHSAWTFKKKVKYLTDSAFSFSSSPIRGLLILGLVGVLVSLVFSAVVIWARLSGRIEVPGYSPVILTIVFFGSVNLICLSIVGSYVWRAFENTKQRPGSVVMYETLFNQEEPR